MIDFAKSPLHDDVMDALGNRERFFELVDEDNAPDVYDYLSDLHENLRGQLVRHGGDHNADWTKRTESMRLLVSSRINSVRRFIATLEPVSTVDSGGQRVLRVFIERLIEVIQDSDQAHRLDTIYYPFNNITAADWYENRLDNAAKQAVAA